MASACMLLCASCTQQAPSKAAAATEKDSISFAVGVYMAEDMPKIAAQLNITPDCMPDFIRGIRDGFPASDEKRALAYSNGLHIGSRAYDMMLQAQQLLYADSTQTLAREQFIEGVVAAVYGGEKASNAIAYFNQYKYKAQSEQFMTDNATRNGVATLPNGLQYKMLHQGQGAVATPADTVRCIYKGTFTNGRTFDSSRGAIAKLDMGSLVPGFAQALCMLPEGSRCKIYVPWQLGYGAEGTNTVPPYAPLVYDIEIVEVIKATR